MSMRWIRGPSDDARRIEAMSGRSRSDTGAWDSRRGIGIVRLRGGGVQRPRRNEEEPLHDKHSCFRPVVNT